MLGTGGGAEDTSVKNTHPCTAELTLYKGQKDSKQHETGLQRKILKELKNLIGLTMLGGFFSSGREFEEELGYKEKQATEKAKHLCHKKNT